MKQCKHPTSKKTRDGNVCSLCGIPWRSAFLATLDSKTKKVWITFPSVHGNGGWCGDKVLSSPQGMQLKRALKIDPEKKYNVYEDWDSYGTLGAIRISVKPDSNASIYYWDGDSRQWVRH